jgi:hypothetical protein
MWGVDLGLRRGWLLTIHGLSTTATVGQRSARQQQTSGRGGAWSTGGGHGGDGWIEGGWELAVNSELLMDREVVGTVALPCSTTDVFSQV